MNELKESIRKFSGEIRRYLEVARLLPSLQWLLPLAPMSGALLLASRGAPPAGATFGLMVATLCLWGVAWTFNDLMNALRMDHANSLIMRGVLTTKQSVVLISVLALVVLMVGLLLGWRFNVISLLAILVSFTYPLLRKHTYLIDAWTGLGIACTVPMAYAAVGHWPDKLGALLAVVTLLWATGWWVLHQWPRHNELMERRMRTLGMMFGSGTGYVVTALQVAVLIGAWMAAGQEKPGTFYTAALALSTTLIAWQSLLLHRKGTGAVDPALRLHLLAGACLWLALAVPALQTHIAISNT